MPRPADYVAVFKPLEEKALDLCEALRALSGYYTEQFAKRKISREEVEAALLDLCKVANDVITEFQGKPSQGARTNTALTEAIRLLRRTFRKYYAKPVEVRRKSGALSYRTDAEKRELEFVWVALKDARLISPSYTGLEALFRDSRCAQPEERAQTIERIASKLQKGRKKAGR